MMRTYEPEFVARMKDFAALGLSPVQIATRMGLLGDERRDFLFQITQARSPLNTAWREARGQVDDDLDSALMSAAVSGDVQAIELEQKTIRQREYDDLCRDLFGI